MSKQIESKLGVKLPKRKIIDWLMSVNGYCACGRYARLSEEQCPECQDANYQEALESAYQDRIMELLTQKKMEIPLQREKSTICSWISWARLERNLRLSGELSENESITHLVADEDGIKYCIKKDKHKINMSDYLDHRESNS